MGDPTSPQRSQADQEISSRRNLGEGSRKPHGHGTEFYSFGHKYIAAELEQLPFKDNSVDCVLIFDVIEHLSNQEKHLLETTPVLPLPQALYELT